MDKKCEFWIFSSLIKRGFFQQLQSQFLYHEATSDPIGLTRRLECFWIASLLRAKIVSVMSPSRYFRGLETLYLAERHIKHGQSKAELGGYCNEPVFRKSCYALLLWNFVFWLRKTKSYFHLFPPVYLARGCRWVAWRITVEKQGNAGHNRGVLTICEENQKSLPLRGPLVRDIPIENSRKVGAVYVV